MGATEVTIGQFKQFCATCYKTQAEQHHGSSQFQSRVGRVFEAHHCGNDLRWASKTRPHPTIPATSIWKEPWEQHAVALKRAGSTYLDPGFAVTDDSNDARHLKLAEEKIAAMK